MTKPQKHNLTNIAKAHGISLKQSHELNKLLSEIELMEIPEELLVTLATSLELIFQLNNEKERAIKK
jgi:type III secretion system FlhB-like substrate exporter